MTCTSATGRRGLTTAGRREDACITASRRLHPNVNWKDFSWLQPTTDDRLTLQTCNGWKDDDPRFIVVARRVPDAKLTPRKARHGRLQ